MWLVPCREGLHYTINARPSGLGSIGIAVEWADCRKLDYKVTLKQEKLEEWGLVKK